MIRRLGTGLAVVLLLCGSVAAQDPAEIGLPFITNYGVRDYSAGGFNWAITQDHRGIMYFGNQWGVLEFDGTNWRLMQLSNESTVRSLDVDDAGRIWVGGVGDLGYLEPDSVGNLVFISVLDEIPVEYRDDITDVWHTYSMDDGTYFLSDQHIFRFSEDGLKRWTSDKTFHVGFRVNDELYIREWDTGLMRINDNGLELVPGGDRFDQERIYVMLPYDDGRAIVVTRTMGVFLFDGETFEQFETEIDDWLAQHLIYLPGTRLMDGGFAFASISGGVAIINHDGSLRQIIDQAAGIPDNGVIFTYQDLAGDLWFGMTDGISRVAVGSPYSVFDERNGFASRLTDVTRYEGDLFAASQSGFYRFDRDARSWNGIPGTNNQIFAFEIVGDRLVIAAGLEGLYEYHDGELSSIKQTIDNSFSIATVQQSEFDSTRVFVGLMGGIGSFRLINEQWVFEGTLPDYNWNRFFIQEESRDVIWAGGPNSAPVRVALHFEGDSLIWNKARAVIYGQEKGGSETGAGITKIGSTFYSITDNEWVRYDPGSDSFVRAPELDAIDITNGGGGFVRVGDGRFWMSGGGNIGVISTKTDGGLDIEADRFNALTDLRPGAMMVEDDGVAWIVTLDGLVRYSPTAGAETVEDLSALIRSVNVGADSVIFAGASEPSVPRISFDDNSVRFGYSSTNFRNADLNRYQTRLVGFEDGFTEWTTDTRREFTNLNPGQYEFQVRARTGTGLESSVASYSFAILPPWYRTWWAYSLYVLGLIVLVGGFVGLRTRQLHARQRELEQTVEERTAEINQRVEELAVINSVQEGLVAEMDIQGIYDLVGDRIRDLFDAQVVVIRTFDWEGDREVWNYAIEKDDRLSVEPRAIASMFKDLRETVVINDDFRAFVSKYDHRPVPAGDEPKSGVFVPLIVGDQVRGNVSLQNVDREHAFSESDVRLLTTLANSMSVALENARLFDQTTHLLEESDQRAEELSTVNRISKALVAQLDLDALIDLIGNQIQELFKADMAYVAIHDKPSGMINFPFGYGDDFPPIEFGEGFTSQIIQTGRPLLINEDVSGSFQEMGIEEIGKTSASFLGVPVSVGSEVIGVISVQSASQTGRFDEDDQRLLSTIAANVGVALQNAESYRKLNKTLSDLKSTQEQLVTQEKMASLGQLTAGIAHEIKNPLNFVNNFAELISELAKEAGELFDKNRDRIPDDLAEEIIPTMSGLAVNARQVHKHGKRADAIVKNMMDHARGGSGERYRVEVNPMVEEYLQLAYHGMKAQVPDLDVDVRKDLDPSVGTLDMAPREIGRVIVNLVNNAIYAVHEKAINTNGDYRPEVTVATVKRNGSVEIAVSDNGPGIPDDVREKVFEPLFTTKPTGSGTGLGLSLSFDIVTQAHGGKLDFQSSVGDGTTFTVSLPSRR